MGLFSQLFFGIMNQNNDNQRNYQRREPTAEDYIKSGEIEKDNYDEWQKNYIDEHGELPEDKE